MREKKMSKKMVFSGTRATGRLHLGNYLGAVKGYIELQNDPAYDCIYMAVDLHTITTPYDHQTLAVTTKDIIMDYLAAGIDPDKAIITAQSLVPEHSYLFFLFASAITMARMQHLPTFKEKVKQHPENVTMALLNYPVLMAADILVYRAGLVPVGIDQEPHLEVAREIARKMNDRYFNGEEFFPEPQRFATKGEYVPSLAGAGKMSKSIEGSYINLMDSLELIQKKVAAIPTDSGKGSIKDLKTRVKGQKEYTDDSGSKSEGVASLMAMVELFMGNNKRFKCEKEYSSNGLRYGDLKKSLAEAIFKELKPIQAKRKELEAKPDYVDQIIHDGAKRARAIASKNLREVKEKMGFIVSR